MKNMPPVNFPSKVSALAPKTTISCMNDMDKLSFLLAASFNTGCIVVHVPRHMPLVQYLDDGT